MNRRDAVLSAVRAASELHEQFELRKQLVSGDRPVDVFQLINELGVFLLFRPLNGLLGLFMKSPVPGILVTTKRSLAIQRFTAAHELGHFVLEHSTRLDSEASLALARQSNTDDVPMEEVAAEVFASELLLPKWLIMAIAKRQGWNASDFANPNIVYQLSLRAGASYEATWRMLISNNWLPAKAAEVVRKTEPKFIKQQVLGDIPAIDPWADAPKITLNDNMSRVLSGPQDTVVIEVNEHSSSGYTWESTSTSAEVISDQTLYPSDRSIGGVATRKLVIRGTNNVDFGMKEVRLWDADAEPLNQLNLNLDFSGKEVGLPRVARG